MKNLIKPFLLAVVAVIFNSSCAERQTNSTFWVNSYKTHCDAGAGKSECMLISKTKDLSNPNWQLFYSNIDGFNFEEGYLQQLEVKTTVLPKNKVPADASSVQYSLIKVLNKMQDPRQALNGTWNVQTINGQPLSDAKYSPYLTVDMDKNNISGSDGCNTYVGNIDNITANNFQTKPIANTRKMCIDMTTPNSFMQALNSVSTYSVDNGVLTLYDASNSPVLTFNKKALSFANSLNANWTLVRLNGGPINRTENLPTLDINLQTGMAKGSDGFNTYQGKLEKSSNGNFVLVLLDGQTALKKAPANSIAIPYLKNLQAVKLFDFRNQQLILMDASGKELLAYILTP